MREYIVVGVTAMELFASQCACGETNVWGFWNQLNRTVDNNKLRVRVNMNCRKCNKPWSRTYRLSTGKRWSHRLIDWTSLYLFVWKFIPRRFNKISTSVVLWLERNVRV